MTRPHLDHAGHDGREWTYVGCWREWNDARAEWEPSAPPPAEAEFFIYRERILGERS